MLPSLTRRTPCAAVGPGLSLAERPGQTPSRGESVASSLAWHNFKEGAIHALADRLPLTRRTPRLYQRAYRRRNTQHSRIYDELGLAPTVSTTSAVYVWHDGTQARLLQARELARLQGLPDSFVLPEGRVVATRLIGNAVPPALIRALLL